MENLASIIREICEECGKDKSRMMDVLRKVQDSCRYVSGEALDLIAQEMGVKRVEVESVATFYSFFTQEKKGKVIIRLCDDIIDEMKGSKQVADTLKQELGIGFGETTADGNISLEHTPCIGMCDQGPAAMVNDVVVTNMTVESTKEMIKELKDHLDPQKLVKNYGDGNNGHELVKAMVVNNIYKKGEVFFTEYVDGTGLKKALSMEKADVAGEVKESGLRGRGGAGFPTGLKWKFAAGAQGEHIVICNADEGEPGTFKDRVLLTESPDLLFEGMTIAGYAIGAKEGIVYLRGEYNYLRPFLEKVLNDRRENNLLGNNVCEKDGFNFDIRIQMGAGAYVCGEETALISSCEGLRGDPKDRPPFPTDQGYLKRPTVVNNVETFICATRILEKGAKWFSDMGSEGTSGTKLLSISGDCKQPGIYELEYGTPLKELLTLCGADDAIAVQVGGACGQLIPTDQFDRKICFNDLATGGSMMAFGPGRDVLEIAAKFMEFFIEESCGYCTPCRVGNVLLKERLDKVINGKGEPADIDYMKELGATVLNTSRCGLGQTSPNPILSTIENFRERYDKLVKESTDGMQPDFDIKAALKKAENVQGRKTVIFSDDAH